MVEKIFKKEETGNQLSKQQRESTEKPIPPKVLMQLLVVQVLEMNIVSFIVNSDRCVKIEYISAVSTSSCSE